MKISEITLSSNHRILRNGKIINSRKNAVKKKKPVLKTQTKNDNQLSFFKRSQGDLNKLQNKNKKKITEVVNNNYNNLIKSHDSYLLLLKWPSIFNHVLLGDQIYNNFNKNVNKNCYTNLEDYIQLNEVLIYNELEPKIEIGQELITTKKTKQSIIPLNSLKNKKKFKTKTLNNSVTNHNFDVRITRGKSIKLQAEKRKQLDKVIFDKFPNNKFNMIAIQLNDINKEVQFLRTLGLICRFKCPLSPVKLKRKCS